MWKRRVNSTIYYKASQQKKYSTTKIRSSDVSDSSHIEVLDLAELAKYCEQGFKCHYTLVKAIGRVASTLLSVCQLQAQTSNPANTAPLWLTAHIAICGTKKDNAKACHRKFQSYITSFDIEICITTGVQTFRIQLNGLSLLCFVNFS